MRRAGEHSDLFSQYVEYNPAAPKPQARPLHPLALIHTLRRNPLECWAA